MGWGILLALALGSFALLWRYAKMPRSALELTGAALLLGVAGYAWQGAPTQPGINIQSREAESKLDPRTADSRKNMMGQFGNEAQWMDYADTMTRMGATQTAVLAMRSGIRDNPKSPNLWVGLGNALVAHGDGFVSPAARFAFDRAAQLSPKHPGPPFFLAVALAGQGQREEAARIWQGLLDRAPKDAPYRADIEARLASIGGARP
jgi:cytochrome c-type biogenesis protein CcmH